MKGETKNRTLPVAQSRTPLQKELTTPKSALFGENFCSKALPWEWRRQKMCLLIHVFKNANTTETQKSCFFVTAQYEQNIHFNLLKVSLYSDAYHHSQDLLLRHSVLKLRQNVSLLLKQIWLLDHHPWQVTDLDPEFKSTTTCRQVRILCPNTPGLWVDNFLRGKSENSLSTWRSSTSSTA